MAPGALDRTDLHLGLQVAFFGYPEGTRKWSPEILEIDLDSIENEDCKAFREFRAYVPEDIFPTAALLHLGQNARHLGVANRVREERVQMPNGRTTSILPPLARDALLLDNIFRPSGTQSSIVTDQGPNTCSLDVTIFLSACYDFGRMRADAVSLGFFRTASGTQIAFRNLMAHLRYGEGPAVLRQNNRLREVLHRAMVAQCPERIRLHGENDLGETMAYCWDNLRSLSYTWVPTFFCCAGLSLQTADAIPRRRTSHDIELESTPPEKPVGGTARRSTRKVLYPGESLPDLLRKRFFPTEPPEVASRNDVGDMVTPFAPCAGREATCLQLRSKMVRVLDELPPYLFVSINHGSPVSANATRQYLEPLNVEVYGTNGRGRVSVHWQVCAVGICRPGPAAHFIGRAWSPPGFPHLQGEFCEFDGMVSAEPQRIQVTSLLEGLQKSDRVTALIYMR